jgi:ubiquinone/menaquinone biosynthesis C-methylase UbiE
VRSAHLAISSSEYWHETLRDEIMPWVIGSVDLGDDVLEVGPGPGLSTELLRARAARLTAVELDGEMAVGLFSRLSGTNVEIVQAEVTGLPFKDCRFTGAASFSTLHHVPTLEMQDQLLGEIARVLQPGSVFAAYDGIANQGAADLHADLTYNPVDPSTIEARLLGAGFASVEVHTVAGLRWAAIAHTAP